jgi:uncharacterized protein YeaO (DUF488 family)
MKTTDQELGRPHSAGAPGDRNRAEAKHIGSPPHSIQVRRAYEPRAPDDGRRVLVDRLWPRGLSKSDLADVEWRPEVAPSARLRKWFGHRPERWAEFRERYFAELRSNPAVESLRSLIDAGSVTLIYGACDEAHNQAVALAAYLTGPAISATEEKR